MKAKLFGTFGKKKKKQAKMFLGINFKNKKKKLAINKATTVMTVNNNVGDSGWCVKN